MSQKNKNRKNIDNRPKTENEADRNGKSKLINEILNANTPMDLKTYFTNDELQEIKGVLKIEDLSRNPVIAATILNKFNLVKQLLQEGSSVNEIGPNQTTPLMWAVKRKNVEILDFLLSSGADVSAKNDKGDDIMMLALENRLWDEKGFIIRWNNIKHISCVDIDFPGKHGRNMLHATIHREWNDFLKMLISRKVNVNAPNSNKVTPLMLASCLNNVGMVNTLLLANADALKKDSTGCTALCYAISTVISKSIKTPHLVIDKLVSAFRINGITFKDFLEKQVILVLNCPVKLNKAGQPVSDPKNYILPYALRFEKDDLKIFLETNIFKKIAQATEKFLEESHQMTKCLNILNEILQHCNNCFDETETRIMENFVTDGGADVCLKLLKKYGNETIVNYDFISNALLPLMIAGISKIIIGRIWLYDNLDDILQFYRRFLSKFPLKDTTKFPRNQKKEDILKFSELINDIKLEKAFNESKEKKCTLIVNKYLQNPTENLAKTPKLESTRRREKPLKARIAKIESVDLTQSLNQNTKGLFETTYFSDTSILQKSTHSKASESDDPGRTQGWRNYTSWQQIWSMTESNDYTPITKFDETLNLLENDMAMSFDDIYNTDLYELTDIEKLNSEKQEIVSLYSDWKNKSNFALESNKNDTDESVPEIIDDNKEEINDSKIYLSEVTDSVDCTLEYLSELLQRIITSYQKYWKYVREIIKNSYRDIQHEKEEFRKIVPKMEKIEREHINRVQTEFNNLIASIKEHSEDHIQEFSKLMEKLETILVNHKIRGRTIMQESLLQLKQGNNFTDQLEKPFEIKKDNPITKAIKESLYKFKEGTENYKSSHSNDSEINLQDHPDALYIKEMLELPPRPPVDLEKRRIAKLQTMANAYHLLPSILSLCDEEDEEIIKTKSDTAKESSTSNSNITKSRKRQSLQETLLAIPAAEDARNLLCDIEDSQRNTESIFISAPSRWCNIIRSLKMVNNYQILLNGDVRIYTSDKQECHLISSGGNFSPVILGLDAEDRPLAVKRIPRGSSISRIMKELLNPILGLRNTNILHYFTCRYEENELVLATPLCEYNMGEYVMIMKQTPNIYVRSIDAVKQFLAGLRFLHDRLNPIVHGNIKPSNIFIDLNGTVRVAEFGMHKALYTLSETPITSIIWFSQEMFNDFRQAFSITCTCASDIQVAGMLIHFILTAGKHPYGEDIPEILNNLERAKPRVAISDVDLHDLISWMLLYDPRERPGINQVLSHVFFWTLDRKWRFILACTGMSPHGTPLCIPVKELHLHIDIAAIVYPFINVL